jgi:hypothetical protein
MKQLAQEEIPIMKTGDESDWDILLLKGSNNRKGAK